MLFEEMEYFIEQYDALIRSICRRLCKMREDVDDLYQTTFLRVMSASRPPDMNKADERNWLITICVNQYKDNQRFAKRHTTLPLVDPVEPDVVLDLPDSRIGALDLYIKNEEQHELWRELCRLNEKYRIPIVLYYFLWKNTSDVAQIMGLPVNTVLSRLHRGRKILERKLR